MGKRRSTACVVREFRRGSAEANASDPTGYRRTRGVGERLCCERQRVREAAVTVMPQGPKLTGCRMPRVSSTVST